MLPEKKQKHQLPSQKKGTTTTTTTTTTNNNKKCNFPCFVSQILTNHVCPPACLFQSKWHASAKLRYSMTSPRLRSSAVTTILNYMNSVSLRRSLRIFIGSKRAVHEWDNSIWYSIKYDDRYNHMFTNHQYFTDIWSIWGGFPKSLNYFLRVQFTLTSIWCTQNMRDIYTTIFYPTTGLRRATLLVNWVNIIGVYQRK